MSAERPAADLGARLSARGADFGLWSPAAEAVELLLFEHAGDLEPARTVPLLSGPDGIWRGAVRDATAGTLYGFRARGPRELGFDSDKLLVDPCALVLAPSGRPAREAARSRGANLSSAPKAVVADLSRYDWNGDRPPRGDLERSVVYELHVRGFTRHASSGVPERLRGTFRGLLHRIPHLVGLGVTAVELMPVQAFDAEDAPFGRTNYWGYSPLAWSAPHPAYGSGGDPLAVLDEFRDLVRGLHAAGIEVWLDVVFNHTAEGAADGPTWHLRGSADREAYLRDADGAYLDVTGCGHTVHANHPMVRSMIVECLAHWVEHMHVDGFRFDLASALTRGADGRPLASPPLLEDIAADPRLAGVRLVAEAWDLGDNYLVGRFPAAGWRDWNDRFRDDLRRHLRGDAGSLEPLLERLAGSQDLYGDRPRGIQYVTCHDGFTLEDLVSYERKHNEANGEGGLDGAAHDHSSNHGVEGPTDDPDILALRERQVRNALALTLLAPGPALLLMGDEMGRTQRGNNNAYALDDETSWLDWGLAERHAGRVRFVSDLVRLRRSLADQRAAGIRSLVRDVDEEDGVALFEEVLTGGRLLLVVVRTDEERRVALPPGHDWQLLLDTAEERIAPPRPVLHDELPRPGRSVALLRCGAEGARPTSAG